MGSPLEPYRSLRMHRKRRQVLGADLNRPESSRTWRQAAIRVSDKG
jgi:hypothetical protein